MKRYLYSGDVNAENGGLFYSTKDVQYLYADAVRIVPASDAGGPDNMFWIDRLTIILPDEKTEKGAARLAEVLRQFDMTPDQHAALSKARRAAALIEACAAYGSYDIEDSTLIQVGPDDTTWSGGDKFTPKVRLRAGASLRRYVRNFYLKD